MATTPTETTWRRVGRFTEADLTAIVTEARSLGRQHAGEANHRMLDRISLGTVVLRNPAGIGWRMIDADLTTDELEQVRDLALLAYREEAMR